MKAHKLFNQDSENDDERLKRDICFLQVFRFSGSKRVAIPKIFEAEEIQDIEQLYAVTGAGVFEVIGRDANNRQIVDRVRIEIEGAERQQPQASPQPQPQHVAAQPDPQPQPQGVALTPVMSGMGLQIPSGTDPQTALMMMILAQGQQAQNAAREDARATQANMTALFASVNKSQADMVVGLANAFGSRGAPPPSSGESGSEFLKGVEVMSSLVQGMRETNEPEDKPLDIGQITNNVVTSLGHISNIAKSVQGSPGPIIPPGTPT